MTPWSDRLELGEGARWVDGRLILVDILTGRLLSADSATLRTIAQLDVPLGAVAPVDGSPGTWMAAAGTGVCILTDAGKPDWLATVADGTAVRVNDGAADADGRFWFGTMAYDGAEDAGSLYRVDHDGTVTRVLERITIPNGPAFTEDGATMYLADTARGLVRRYRVAYGNLSEPELFAELDGPDGMTVDREGGVWIACWGSGTVRRYRADGTLDRVVEIPATQPSSVCLGGGLLHITTAAYGLNPPGPQDGAVFTVPADVPGFSAHAYRGPKR
jgi:sugar lactone lactonase YvrE